MRIVIIGPGRLGRSLDHLWRMRGHDVRLLGRGDAPETGDVVLLTVPDSAIPAVAATVDAGTVLLHCSGALDVDVLRPHAPAGSLHPLMTFPGPEVGIPDLRGVPAAVAGDPTARTAAETLARELGMEPFEVPGDRRLYHASAVLAGNFATVLLGEACRVLEAAGVPADQCAGILAPLALRSIDNARHGVRAALTGPVARGDDRTLGAHRAALAEHGMDDVLALYDALLARARRQLDQGESLDRDES